MLYTKEIAEILEKQLAEVDTKTLDEGGTFRVVATDETKDRDGDIITLDGWEIENYLKNPVILANHYYSIENIIGKATKIYAQNNQIIVEGIFSKSNPLGVLAQRLYEEGMLKTVSVGFIGKERQGEKITKKELLELSFVAVPSNPSAVSLDAKLYEEAIEKGLMIKAPEDNEEEPMEEVTLEKVLAEVQELKSIIKTFSESFDETKGLIKTLADDKAEQRNLDKLKGLGQEFQKCLSALNQEIKAQK